MGHRLYLLDKKITYNKYPNLELEDACAITAYRLRKDGWHYDTESSFTSSFDNAVAVCMATNNFDINCIIRKYKQN